MKDRNIWITVIISVLIHMLVFYEWTVSMPVEAPSGRDVLITFNITHAPGQKARKPVKKKAIKKRRAPVRKEKAIPEKVPVPPKEIVEQKKADPPPVQPEERTEPEIKPAAEAKEEIKAAPPERVADKAVPEPGITKNDTDRKYEFNALVFRKIEEAKIYPMIAKRMGIEGEVSIGFTIFPDGSVDDVEVLSSANSHKLLERAAVTTVKKAAPYVPVPVNLITEKGVRLRVKIAYRLT